MRKQRSQGVRGVKESGLAIAHNGKKKGKKWSVPFSTIDRYSPKEFAKEFGLKYTPGGTEMIAYKYEINKTLDNIILAVSKKHALDNITISFGPRIRSVKSAVAMSIYDTAQYTKSMVGLFVEVNGYSVQCNNYGACTFGTPNGIYNSAK